MLRAVEDEEQTGKGRSTGAEARGPTDSRRRHRPAALAAAACGGGGPSRWVEPGACSASGRPPVWHPAPDSPSLIIPDSSNSRRLFLGVAASCFRQSRWW